MTIERKLIGPLASILIAICALNINGLFRMAFAMEEFASIAILVAAGLLVMACGRKAQSPAFYCFCAAVATYLVIGFVSFDPSISAVQPLTLVRANLATVLIVWAITGYVSSIKSQLELDHLLSFVLICFFLSSLSVWFSPALYHLYAVLPPADHSRFGGFFGNPNEAAICGLIAFTLAVCVPIKNRWLRWVAVLVPVGAVVLTFSKTGICVLIVLVSWFAVRKVSGWGAGLIPIVGALLVVPLVFLPDIASAIAENSSFNLTANQQQRILAVGDILEGRITEETSTGRTELWSVGLSRALESFPKPHGLGSYHNLVGGLMNVDQQWFGVHNTFLMVFGEAGPLALLLLFLTVFLVLMNARVSPYRDLCLPIGLILLVDMMVNHNALVHRYFDLCLGLMLGLSALRFKRSDRRHMVHRPLAVGRNSSFGPDTGISAYGG